MNLKTIIINILFCLLGAGCLSAQDFKVRKFEIDPKDMEARTSPRVGNNGRKCALLKVYVKDRITHVDGSVVGDIQTKGMEKLIYLAHDTKQVRLNFENHFPLHLRFDDYSIPPMMEQIVYVIELVEDNSQSPVTAANTPGQSSSTATNTQTPQAPQPAPSLTPSQMADKGIAAYKSKDYKEAFTWLSQAAEQGEAIAQNYLGEMYYYGYGVTKNYGEAVKWYRKSAEQGYASGQNNLGKMYRYGFGVTQDYGEAVKWYRKSAEQGDAGAQYNLGEMYYKGYGVTKDYGEAVKWYRKSAEQGETKAQSDLGHMYYNGFGVTQDYGEAVKWYRKSAEQGYAYGQYKLGYMYYKGIGVEKDVSQAKEWWRKAAAQGNILAKESLKQYFRE